MSWIAATWRRITHLFTKENLMSVTAVLTVTPSAPNHGDTVTATYTVAGNDPIPPASGTLEGAVQVGEQTVTASVEITLPGTDALPEVFNVPTVAGLTFAVGETPNVFHALVP